MEKNCSYRKCFDMESLLVMPIANLHVLTATVIFTNLINYLFGQIWEQNLKKWLSEQFFKVFLWKETIFSSPKMFFIFWILIEQVCTRTYRKNDPESERRMDTLKKGMSLNYQHHWIVDNMPVTWCYPLENKKKYCSIGFPMGCYFRPHSESVSIKISTKFLFCIDFIVSWFFVVVVCFAVWWMSN